tara:strand:- start:120334 stop:120486 length:153 start_codon:yes stop_codon:yes gene_type:complete
MRLNRNVIELALIKDFTAKGLKLVGLRGPFSHTLEKYPVPLKSLPGLLKG